MIKLNTKEKRLEKFLKDNSCVWTKDGMEENRKGLWILSPLIIEFLKKEKLILVKERKLHVEL